MVDFFLLKVVIVKGYLWRVSPKMELAWTEALYLGKIFSYFRDNL